MDPAMEILIADKLDAVHTSQSMPERIERLASLIAQCAICLIETLNLERGQNIKQHTRGER